MGIITTRVEPKPVPRELDMIEVRNDISGGQNRLFIAQGSLNAELGSTATPPRRYHTNMRMAQLLFTQGKGLYLTPTSLRSLAADLCELAAQIERTA